MLQAEFTVLLVLPAQGPGTVAIREHFKDFIFSVLIEIVYCKESLQVSRDYNMKN